MTKIKTCFPAKATSLEMLMSNSRKGVYAPYVGNPDPFCGLPCDPCDTSVGISERVLDSMYAEAKKLYTANLAIWEVRYGADTHALHQALKDVKAHMEKYKTD